MAIEKRSPSPRAILWWYLVRAVCPLDNHIAQQIIIKLHRRIDSEMKNECASDDRCDMLRAEL